MPNPPSPEVDAIQAMLRMFKALKAQMGQSLVEGVSLERADSPLVQ